METRANRRPEQSFVALGLIADDDGLVDCRYRKVLRKVDDPLHKIAYVAVEGGYCCGGAEQGLGDAATHV